MGIACGHADEVGLEPFCFAYAHGTPIRKTLLTPPATLTSLCSFGYSFLCLGMSIYQLATGERTACLRCTHTKPLLGAGLMVAQPLGSVYRRWRSGHQRGRVPREPDRRCTKDL